jgi:hypothetical protein
VIVICLGGYSTFDELNDTIGVDASLSAREKKIVAEWGSLDRDSVESERRNVDEVFLVKLNGEVIFSQYDPRYYKDELSPGDYMRREGMWRESGSIEVYFDRREANLILEQNQAWQNLLFLCIVLVSVFCYLFFYSPHFAITVTDPIHVMKRGLAEPDYNLEVSIPELYETDDVFRLAQHYNDTYLPLKDRSRDSESVGATGLKLDDIKEILE